MPNDVLESTFPNTFYRVSIKAIIRNDAGRVLLVKEDTDDWNLPGGGLDHGETIEEALGRELLEEINVTNIVSTNYKGTHPLYSHGLKVWFMWVLYEVEIETPESLVGDHVSVAEFVDISAYKNSNIRGERRIYAAVMGEEVE